MKRKLLPRAILVAILLALPAAADAPRDQYARFDGDSPTIMDTFTKLEWDRRSVLRNIPLGVDAGCSLLTSLDGGPGIRGRLPTVKELLTILDEEPHFEYEGTNVSKMIDALAFADTPVDLPYWTSTPAGAGTVWVVNFSTGVMEARATTLMANARCVR
jgi:hypothetical protein